MAKIKKIDHLGIAVPSLEAAIKLYQSLLGCEPDHIEAVAEQKVRAAFFPLGESNLELLEATSPDSPIAKFIEKRGSGGIHHICVEVEDIDGCLAAYKAAGVQLIDEKPRIGAHGKRVAFVHPKSTGGVLLELSEPTH